ncbi:YbgA family protein [Pseudomonas sp. MT3]
MPVPTPRPQLAISLDLLNALSEHQAPRLCLEVLGRHFDFVPLPPEIVDAGDPPQAAPLQNVCGYIVTRQPSGAPHNEALHATHPERPVEEESRLDDPVLRENFLTRVFACAAWQALCTQGLTRAGLIAFHSRYKYQLMAHNPRQYRLLGQRLATLSSQPLDSFAARYIRDFMQALASCASRGTHSNVLQHLAGYLKRDLPALEKSELQHLIDQYRCGVVPLAAPLSLLKQHFRRYPHPYLQDQAYLQRQPEGPGPRATP